MFFSMKLSDVIIVLIALFIFDYHLLRIIFSVFLFFLLFFCGNEKNTFFVVIKKHFFVISSKFYEKKA